MAHVHPIVRPLPNTTETGHSSVHIFSIRVRVQTQFCSSASTVPLPVDSNVLIFFDHDAPKDTRIGRVFGKDLLL